MSKTPTALIVDDSTVARTIIKGQLPAHYRVIEANNGKDALTLYQQHQPDILFLDLLLPGMDGVTLLQHVQAINPSANVVVVTSNIQRPVKEQLSRMGVLAFIEKPANRPEAVEAVQQVLTRLEGLPPAFTLTTIQKETLSEVITLGIGRAAQTLSELLGEPVALNVPHVSLHPVAELEDRLRDRVPEPVTSVHQVFSGAFSGDALMVFPVDTAQRLVRLIIRAQGLEGQVPETDLSTLMEIGNMVINAVLSTFGEMLQVEITFSVPNVAVETVGSIIRSVSRQRFPVVQYFLLIETDFQIARLDIEGHLVLLIGVDSAELLLEAVQQLVRDTIGT